MIIVRKFQRILSNELIVRFEVPEESVDAKEDFKHDIEKINLTKLLLTIGCSNFVVCKY